MRREAANLKPLKQSPTTRDGRLARTKHRVTKGGAAVATTIGRSTGVAYQLWHLFRVGRIIRLRLADFKPQGRLIRSLLSVASGGTGQYLIASVDLLTPSVAIGLH